MSFKEIFTFYSNIALGSFSSRARIGLGTYLDQYKTLLEKQKQQKGGEETEEKSKTAGLLLKKSKGSTIEKKLRILNDQFHFCTGQPLELKVIEEELAGLNKSNKGSQAKKQALETKKQTLTMEYRQKGVSVKPNDQERQFSEDDSPLASAFPWWEFGDWWCRILYVNQGLKVVKTKDDEIPEAIRIWFKSGLLSKEVKKSLGIVCEENKNLKSEKDHKVLFSIFRLMLRTGGLVFGWIFAIYRLGVLTVEEFIRLKNKNLHAGWWVAFALISLVCIPLVLLAWSVMLICGVLKQVLWLLRSIIEHGFNILGWSIRWVFWDHFKVGLYLLLTIGCGIGLHYLHGVVLPKVMTTILGLQPIKKILFMAQSVFIISAIYLLLYWVRAFFKKAPGKRRDKVYTFLLSVLPYFLIIGFDVLMVLDYSIFVWNQTVPALVPFSILLFCYILATIYEYRHTLFSWIPCCRADNHEVGEGLSRPAMMKADLMQQKMIGFEQKKGGVTNRQDSCDDEEKTFTS